MYTRIPERGDCWSYAANGELSKDVSTCTSCCFGRKLSAHKEFGNGVLKFGRVVSFGKFFNNRNNVVKDIAVEARARGPANIFDLCRHVCSSLSRDPRHHGSLTAAAACARAFDVPFCLDLFVRDFLCEFSQSSRHGLFFVVREGFSP